MTGRHAMFDGVRDVAVSVPVVGTENVMVPVIRAVVSCEDDRDLILLQRRSGDTESVHGKFEIPGGVWRAGASPIREVAREVAEETGIEVSSVSGVAIAEIDDRRSVAVIEPIAVLAGFHEAFPAVHVVLAAVGSGVPRGQGGESYDVRWWPRGELRAELAREPDGFIPSSRCALEAYFAFAEKDSVSD